ncbi:hypothetical protein BGZ65_002204 [Modicella reniformis]|uniref:Rho-GAP domain-containing protein n=1 Tax=Modicella reniformis TaxID=1440133 RepID=A0A9P6MLF6_9FUNG|nr:hypothetical protein BGZ65_002204 [Modicella reniformis]
MFRLVNKRLAVNRELESLKQEFNQCSLPIEFVHRVVVPCVDEIMERGLNHPFILKNTYPASVVAAMITLMADPERRGLFSLKCMRIDTVAGVMLAVLKNLREAIVPMEIQEKLTSGKYTQASTPTSSSQSLNKICTVNSLLNHPNFPAVNRALLMELLNLSLAILNRSSVNHVKPNMLASILGPHIFSTQHATILQHSPQQTYSFGGGVALVNDTKRCSKMFYVLLGGYRREILGLEEWEHGPNSAAPSAYNMIISGSAPSSGSMFRGQVNQWFGTASAYGGGMSDQDSQQNLYFRVNNQKRLHRSVPLLRVTSDIPNSSGSQTVRSGIVRSVSTTLSETIRVATAQETKTWNLNTSGSSSKGPAVLRHLRGSQQDSHNTQRLPTVEQQQQALFDVRFRNKYGGRFEEDGGDTDELSNAFRHHNLHRRDSGDSDEGSDEQCSSGMDLARQKRQAIEQMIRECRGTGLDFVPRKSE